MSQTLLLGRKILESCLLASLIFGSLALFHVERALAAPKAQGEVEAQAVKVVNVNAADTEELQTIRGIGPALAERIVEYRKQNGPFKRIEDLANIRGIGEAKLEKIKSQVSI